MESDQAELAGANSNRGAFDRTRVDLEAWRAGDSHAFDRLWLRYRPALEILAARRIAAVRNSAVKARLTSDDILQETAITALRKMREFDYRGPGALYAWMETVIGRIVQDAADRWESDKRDAARETAIGALSVSESRPGRELNAASTGPATAAVRSEEHERVVRALEALPERARHVVVLRHYFDAPWNEIAEFIGSPSDEAVRKEHASIAAKLAVLLRSV